MPRSASACASSSRAALASSTDDRFLEQRQPLVFIERRSGGAQREPQRPLCADAPSQGQLFPGKLRRGPGLTQRRERRHGIRPPVARPAQPQRLEPLATPQQVIDTFAHMTLGDPQPPAGDQVRVDVDLILGDAERFALLGQLGRRLQGSTLDLHDHRDREQQQHDEMSFADQDQSRLGLDLGVVERTLRKRDRRALSVDDAQTRRVTLGASALQGDVEHANGQVVLLPEPQRRQRQERGGVRRRRWEAGGERRLHARDRSGRRPSPVELLLGGVNIGHRLEVRMPARLDTESLQVRVETGAEARGEVRDQQQLGTELERALRIERPKLLADRREGVDGDLGRAAARDVRAARQPRRGVGSRRQVGPRSHGRPQMLLGRLVLPGRDLVLTQRGQDLAALLLAGRFGERSAQPRGGRVRGAASRGAHGGRPEDLDPAWITRRHPSRAGVR